MSKKEEQTIQINIVSALSLIARQNNFAFFSVPNEAALKMAGFTDIPKKTQYAIMGVLKKMGLLPGVSDLVILQNGRAYCMEVKTASGRQSDSQMIFEQWCIDNDTPYSVVRSVDEAILQLRAWGVVG